MGFGPSEPKLRSVDVLVWLYRERPEQFTIKDVMQKFGIQRGDAQRRVNYLRFIWNAVRLRGAMKAHRRGRRELVYTLTKWGQTYAAKAQKAKSRARRAGEGRIAANPQDQD